MGCAGDVCTLLFQSTVVALCRPDTNFLPHSVWSILGVDKDFSPKRRGHFWVTSNFYSEGDEGCYGAVGAVYWN
jgi:hypothetical protein